jgi:hypothetical protein
MMFVDFQREGRPGVRCFFGAGPVPEAYSSYCGEIAPRQGGRLGSPVGGAEVARKWVCTMCTPWASDRVVLVPDWAGLRMFVGEWRKFKARNTVRVPPRAQCFRRSEAYWCIFVCTLCTLRPLI